MLTAWVKFGDPLQHSPIEFDRNKISCSRQQLTEEILSSDRKKVNNNSTPFALLKMKRPSHFLLQISVIWLVASIGSAQMIEIQGVQKVSAISGGFNGSLQAEDRFGTALANIGDINGDGVPDLAVGAEFDDDGADGSGAVWILFMNANGTVMSEQKISSVSGGFGGQLDADDNFGRSIAGLGDLDHDSVPDIAVGADSDDDGGFNFGAVWVLFLRSDGTVKAFQKISSIYGGFSGGVGRGDKFSLVSSLGDIDGDGVTDIAVGAPYDDDGGTNSGSVYILFLRSDGTVRGQQKISNLEGGMDKQIQVGGHFGISIAGIPDLDGDGIQELAVGADKDDTGGVDRGAVWLIRLNTDGTVRFSTKLDSTHPLLQDELDNGDQIGVGVAAVGDWNKDGATEIAIGTRADDDGGYDVGAVWLISLYAHNLDVAEVQKLSAANSELQPHLDREDFFGWSITSLGDLDGNGLIDIAVSATRDDDGAADAGALYCLFLSGIPPVLELSDDRISATSGIPLRFTIQFPTEFSGLGYVVLGSSGTGPTMLNGFEIPLSADRGLVAGLHGWVPPFALGFHGLLGPNGEGEAWLMSDSRLSLYVGRSVFVAVVAYDQNGLIKVGMGTSRPYSIQVEP